jgi:hypothetical protein
MSAPFAFLVWAGVGVVIAGAFVALVRRLPADQPAT